MIFYLVKGIILGGVERGGDDRNGLDLVRWFGGSRVEYGGRFFFSWNGCYIFG